MERLMWLYALQVTDASGRAVQETWQYVRSECRALEEAGPVRQRRTLTWADVLSAVRRVGVPPASVEAPGYTLVNLDTTFYTEPATIDRSLDIIGFAVDVHIEPTSYVWYWGDGATTKTNQPGRPYPATDVTHLYHHATEKGASLAVRVDVTYAASYRVDGGTWQTIPETLTIRGIDTALPVKQAAALLVGND
jgi:hypothetical protein